MKENSWGAPERPALPDRRVDDTFCASVNDERSNIRGVVVVVVVNGVTLSNMCVTKYSE